LLPRRGLAIYEGMGSVDESGPPARLDPQAAGPASSAAERWTRVKPLFLAALEVPESDRLAFVAEKCGGDSGVREEVESLLASHGAAGAFAEVPAAALLCTAPEPAAPVRLAPGTRLGPYEITAFLSAGGMGAVYRARHTLLARDVAIKTLTGSAWDEQARRRLIREARHAARLDHPNICAIHEVGQADGVPYIVMELVEGRSLADAIRENRPSVDEALAIATQVAEALQHAHEHSIVHRDLKSSNVMLDRAGRPVVLDFGVSRRLRGVAGAAGDPTVTSDTILTDHGALEGTLTHMAPEVLLGCEADPRSDVWSFGVLLHEVTTGTLPFKGRTPFETTSAILHEAPRPPARGVPLSVRLLIERCLAKDPEARYAGAAEVLAALAAIRRRRAWPLIRLLVAARRRAILSAAAAALAVVAIGGAALGLRSVAVGGYGAGISTIALLPLDNATGDAAGDYYAAGLTEALAAKLGSNADVRVISGASAARVARTAGTRRDAARQLGADAVLDGRVRATPDRIAVDVRLIEARHGRTIWSESFERSTPQVLVLQADVVRALATELRLGLRSTAQERLGTVRTVSPEAYEAFLRGRFEYNRRTSSSLHAAVGHLLRAIELDPTYAPAHAALADCFNQFGTLMVGTGSPREYRPRAEAAAIRALQIDPLSAEAHATLGYVRHYDWRFDEAERSFRRAVELNPSYPLARIWYANLLMSRGRYDDALVQARAALGVDPFSLIINTNVGWVLIVAGSYDEAVEQLTRTVALDSNYTQAHWRLAGALMSAGRAAESAAHAARVVELAGRTPPVLGLLAAISSELGDTLEVAAIRDELVRRADAGYVPPGTLADVYNLLGDVDNALVWFEQALEERANWAVYVSLDPSAGAMQRDPRFRRLLTRYGMDRDARPYAS
jgi:eukaryotic-like serine/threonine-protein kinase